MRKSSTVFRVGPEAESRALEQSCGTRFRVGTRVSKLAMVQTENALAHLKEVFPGFRFEITPGSSPGDRDHKMDLRESPSDFFTRDLDQAVMQGEKDCAIHSAKDFPDPCSDGLDWFWLPWRQDPRDVLVLPRGKSIADLPTVPRIGISSERREKYCAIRFPGARICAIRGNIEDRIEKLDAGEYDMIIMAAAALLRLRLEQRITEWIPLSELPTPEGQGALTISFKAGDRRFTRLRSFFVKAVTFAGAGAGSTDTCTIAGINALQRCDVCLYDALIDAALLDTLPGDAHRIPVGKRCGHHSVSQDAINRLIAVEARKGRKVVRLKTGDPGVFARLAEEVASLDALELPYRVIPGVSSLNIATTGTGMLLTRRGVSRGFCVMTPRQQGGKMGHVGAEARTKLPIVYFMAVSVTKQLAKQMIEDGTSTETAAAVVFGAGTDDEIIVRGKLSDIDQKLARQTSSPTTDNRAPNTIHDDLPGLFIVGAPADCGFHQEWGALRGKRVLLTCSEALQDKAATTVLDLGGVPVRRPLIRLSLCSEAMETIRRISEYDWVVLTSPSAVRCLVELMDQAAIDTRLIPKLMVCGRGTAQELRKARLFPDAEPESEFGTAGIRKLAGSCLNQGDRVLRLRSDRADSQVADMLSDLGAQVYDCVLYRNEHVQYDRMPAFDIAFFASSSAVHAFVSLWGNNTLTGKTVAAIGNPTAESLKKYGIPCDFKGPKSTVEATLLALAAAEVAESLEKIS